MMAKITISFSDPENPDAFVSHLRQHARTARERRAWASCLQVGTRALTNFDGSPPDAFWVISMTFDSEEAMRAAFASEAGQKTVADMPNYKAGSRVSVVSEV